VNVYGESKLGGEREIRASGAEHLIVRTAWLYGYAGSNFVETMLRLAGRNETLSVVDDQLGAPTNARDLALIIKELVASGATGVLNATNAGSCTWYQFARRIIERAGSEGIRITPVGSSAFPRPAARPANSVLSLAKLTALLGWVPRAWEEALAEYLSER
jgi:dTDP-4-dehydrorhamnose reductase